MKLYHGSEKIVSVPICDHKSNVSDFGEGFYATESEELAGEWAAGTVNGGFINVYELDTSDLKIIDLCSGDHDLLKWLALVINNRLIPLSSPKEIETKDRLLSEFLPDEIDADVIKGYRADNTLFSLCRAYLNGTITKKYLEKAVRQESPCEQVLLRTETALEKLDFEYSEAADGSIYYPKRMMRDLLLKRKQPSAGDQDAYLDDAMRCIGELLFHASAASDGLSEDSILKMFIVSGYASRFEAGDPVLISGMSGAELFYSIMEKCGEYRFLRCNPGMIKDNDERYYTGRLLACYQRTTRLPFSEILSAVSCARLIALFPELSKLPLNEALVMIDDMILSRRSSATRLQACRKRLGLSQKELAAYSGVNIRTLQQYETGDKDINRAAADKVTALSRTLYCSPCDLLTVSIT